ncbi:LemA family protein [Patescibacteria group bacterium]|nr:LemA family protein [Patescibacteria group bacterium]MCL5733310.1 LemA family protein [Patescibacteria group bacterium]
MSLTTIIIIILAVIVIWFIAIFNSLITRKNRVAEAWSDIEVQLKRRYDLIPNLVESVKGYAAHEKSVIEDVTNARTAAMSAQDPKEKLAAENQLSQTLKSLFAVAENYPQLRASENFQKLQDELVDTEDKIQAARRFYNSNVRDYNIAIEVFPKNLIASIFGFGKKDLFETENDAEKEPVKVSFSK